MEIIYGIIIILLVLLLGLSLWHIRLLRRRCQQLEKYASLYQYCGGIMHDFKNKLSGVLSAADYLGANLDKNDNLQSYVQLIKDACIQTANLSRGALNFSQLSPNKQALINVHDSLQQSLYFLQAGLPSNIKLEQELKATRCMVKGSNDELVSIWLNLGLNAKDSMPSGGSLRIVTDNVRLSTKDFNRMTIKSQPKAGDFLHISISDTGCGIPQNIRTHIFKPFFSTKAQGQGSGLGLAEVARIVQTSGGALRLESSPQGTSFHLYLPLSSEAVSEVDTQPLPQLLQGKRILVIDDDIILQEVLKAILLQSGAEVSVAADSSFLLSQTSDSLLDFDASVLDVVTHSLSGLEAYSQIRSRNSTLKIIFSSGTEPTPQLEAILQGDTQTAFLPKPYDKHQVLDKVCRLLGKN